MQELRILTHPSLLDTGLGCRARRLDQFADEATGIDAALGTLRRSETAHAVGEIALYNHARNLQMVAISQTVSGAAAVEDFGVESMVSDAAASNARPPEADAAKARLLDKSSDLVIAGKPAYFDPQIMGLVQACFAQPDLPQFSNCVSSKAKADVSKTLSRNHQWLAHNVEFQTWSGVREREYTVDDTLAFLGRSAAHGAGPLRFMVQLAIASPAYFADPTKAWYDESNLAPHEYVDDTPWEFAKTGPALDAAIAEIVANSTEHSEIMEDMETFTLLQRFFRAALDGPMSESFPFEEFVKIADATEPFVNQGVRTLRWNASSGQIEARLRDILLEAPNASNKVEACLKVLTAANGTTLNQSAWESICGSDALTKELSSESEELVSHFAMVRDMRFELGLPEDDILAFSYSLNGCPKP